MPFCLPFSFPSFPRANTGPNRLFSPTNYWSTSNTTSSRISNSNSSTLQTRPISGSSVTTLAAPILWWKLTHGCTFSITVSSVLYPSVPADIIHHIDHHSALCPPKFRHQNNFSTLVQSSHGMVLRSLASNTGNHDEIICPVCGEPYGTYERWKQHFAYPPWSKSARGTLPKMLTAALWCHSFRHSAPF